MSKPAASEAPAMHCKNSGKWSLFVTFLSTFRNCIHSIFTVSLYILWLLEFHYQYFQTLLCRCNFDILRAVATKNHGNKDTKTHVFCILLYSFVSFIFDIFWTKRANCGKLFKHSAIQLELSSTAVLWHQLVADLLRVSGLLGASNSNVSKRVKKEVDREAVPHICAYIYICMILCRWIKIRICESMCCPSISMATPMLHLSALLFLWPICVYFFSPTSFQKSSQGSSSWSLHTSISIWFDWTILQFSLALRARANKQ